MPRPPLPDGQFGKNRTVRMSDDLWEQAAAQAQKQGISIGQFVRDAVERHVLLCKLRGGKQPRRR